MKMVWRESPRLAGALLAGAVALAGAALPERLDAQVLNGLLLEDATETPIDLAQVVLVSLDGDSVATTLTDENGFFSLRPSSGGSYFLVASALGYRAARSETLELGDDEVRVTQMHLSLRPIPVSGVTVESEIPETAAPELVANGFYDRIRSGDGEFLTPDQIARHPATYTPQLFREMHMVRLVPNRDRGSGPWNDMVQIVRNEGRTQEKRLCTPYIWVDDVLTELMPGEGLDDVAPKEDIMAIEVYRAPFGPPLRHLRDFDPEHMCGAVLIWTYRK